MRLVELADQVAWDENKRLVGTTVELMVAEGEGRKDTATHRLSGRARDNRLVHFTAVDADGRPVDVRPGDMVEVEVTYAAPHHLVADAPVTVRTTDAGRRRVGAPDRPEAAGCLARPADRRRPRAAARRHRLLPVDRTAASSAGEAVGDDRGSAAGADRLEHPQLVGHDGRGQRVEVEPPQVGALLRLDDPRACRSSDVAVKK